MVYLYSKSLGVLMVLVLLGACEKHNKSWDATPPPDNLEELRALGYIDYATDIADLSKQGARVIHPAQVQPGYNLYGMAAECEAKLLDVAGKVIHSWHLPKCSKWRAIELLDEGELVAVGFDRIAPGKTREFVVRLSRTNEVLWKSTLSAHHDIEVQSDGSFLTLSIGHRRVEGFDAPIMEDRLTYLDAKGKLVKEVPLYDMLAQNDIGYRVIKGRQWKGFYDVIHANSVMSLNEKQLIAKSPFAGLGRVLVATRNQNSVFIFDVLKKKLVWAWGQGEIDGPHDASMLPDGQIALFDNGRERGWSRVVVVNPLTRKITWEYHEKDGKRFYSRSRGAVQRLPNGNTLICNSNSGQAVEVDPNGRAVWEFFNPVLNNEGKRAVMLRFRRLSESRVAALLPKVDALP